MTTIPLRERIAELLDPMPWNGWRVLFERSARDAEKEIDAEARERIFAGARTYADSIHAERKQQSLELADKVISLTADGLIELLKDAPSPGILGSREGYAQYRAWHRTVQGLDLSTIGLRQVDPPIEAYRPGAVNGGKRGERQAYTPVSPKSTDCDAGPQP